jgi:hypothetical protein
VTGSFESLAGPAARLHSLHHRERLVKDAYDRSGVIGTRSGEAGGTYTRVRVGSGSNTHIAFPFALATTKTGLVSLQNFLHRRS